ncbi:MAG: hypothetical protein Q8L06_19905 [Pseudohongiella sp.]|nr:hypothetical protein [Pseudohongiella sp.]
MSGVLDAASDCLSGDRLSDIYTLTLDRTTLFRVEQTSTAFAPMTGMYRAGNNTQLIGSRTASGSTVFTEYLLPAGSYWVVATSTATSASAPPAGNYSVKLSQALELADIQSVAAYGPARLVPGVTVSGALKTTDAVEPLVQDGITRYIDGYSFYVSAGTTVNATLVSDFDFRVAHWTGTTFSNATLTQVKVGTAGSVSELTLPGPANYLVYVLGENAAALGTYTLSLETAAGVQPGIVQACTSGIPAITLGQSVSGSLNAATDCYFEGRLSDRFQLTLDRETLFRVEQTSTDFASMTGLYRAGDNSQLLGSRLTNGTSVVTEYLMPAGSYWLNASSTQATASNPRSGAYSVSISQALDLSQVLTSVAHGPVRTLPGTVVNGQLANTDALEPFINDGVTRYLDGVSFYVPAGTTVYASVNAGFDYRLATWTGTTFSNLTFTRQASTTAGRTLGTMLTGPANHILYVIGESPTALGNYTIDLATTPPGGLGRPEACSNNLPIINLGQTVTGQLNGATDCFTTGRLSDRYVLTLSEQTLFRVEQSSDQFASMTGIYRAGNGPQLLGSRITNGSTVLTEYLLPAGNYWLMASSTNTSSESPPTGTYTVKVSEALPLSQVLTSATHGPVRTVPGAMVNGQLTETDALEPVIRDGITRFLDGVSFYVPAGTTVEATLVSSFPHIFSMWKGSGSNNVTLTEFPSNAAGATTRFDLVGPSYYLLYAIGNANRVTGSYTISLNVKGSLPDSAVEQKRGEIAQLVNSIVLPPQTSVPQSVSQQVSTALTQAGALASQVVANTNSGVGNLATSISAMQTISNTAGIGSNVVQAGGAITANSVLTSLTEVAAVVGAISTRSFEMTPQQIAAVQTVAADALSSSSKLISSASSLDTLKSVVAAASDVVSGAAKAGAPLSGDLVTSMEDLAAKAIRSGIQGFAAGVDPASNSAVEAILRSNPAALEFALDVSVQVASTVQSDEATLQQALTDKGAPAAISDSLSAVVKAISNPTGITINGISARETLKDALFEFLIGPPQTVSSARSVMALSTDLLTVDVDSVTGAITIAVPGERYAAAIQNTRIVPASVPKGLYYLRDGRLLVVSGRRVAIELAPVTSDLVGFTALVRGAGFNLRQRDDAAIEIDLGAGNRFVGVFAYDNIAAAVGACGAGGLEEPTTAANSAQHAFVMTCANGARHRILPHVLSADFYDAVNAGVSTDRNTGFITVSGAGRFKPSFFVAPPSAADTAYWQANKNSAGIALRVTDVNGDGINDYVLFTQNGVQPLFGAAP